jgi:WD40 repeat protein
VSPDGQTLAAGYSQGILKLWDLSTSRIPHTIPIGNGQVSSAFFPDGKALAAASNRAFVLWDLEAGRCLVREELPWGCTCLAATGSDRLVAIRDGGIHFWDRHLMPWSTNGLEDRTLLTCLASSADGEIIALGHRTGMIELRKAGTGDLLATLAAHKTVVSSVAFSPDGKTLASGSDDGAVQLWHVPTAQKLFTLAQIDGLRQVAFSPDGRFLGAAVMAGDQPGKVLLWDVYPEKRADRDPK